MTDMPAIRTLMIVDDSEVQRSHIAQMARGLGVAEILEARDGAVALDLLASLPGPPDAMVIDLEMPVMDGVQLIQRICEQGFRVPFIVASTRETALIDAVETMAGALGRPPAMTLSKPFSPARLQQALLRCQSDPARTAASPRAAAPPIDVPQAPLAAAIERRAVLAYYQPKVDMRSGLMRGVEVLARWHDPDLGTVPPDLFIAAAERYGLLYRLTLVILQQALAQCERWRARGLRVPVAVNLSPLMLTGPDLVDEIVALTQRYGVRPDELTLEITEGSVVAYVGSALGALARLRVHGFGLALDDYGTGFSSMQQLSRISFNELKIDRSFVRGACDHQQLRTILESAIGLCARLPLTSVAEGVETLEDWWLLRRLGCDVAQGWLLGKAMAGDDLPQWLGQHARRLGELRAPPAPTEA